MGIVRRSVVRKGQSTLPSGHSWSNVFVAHIWPRWTESRGVKRSLTLELQFHRDRSFCDLARDGVGRPRADAMMYSAAERTGILIRFHRFSTSAALVFDRPNPRGKCILR